MTISRLLRDATDAIAAIGAGNPRFEAQLLLAHAIGKPRVFIFTHPEFEPRPEQLADFAALLERRRSHEPLQYVLGTAAFRHLLLRVRPGVLIPRSETEVLVEHAWVALKRRLQTGISPWLIDVGVGSGAILLAMLDEARRELGEQAAREAFRPLGLDISTIPLKLTAENAAHGNLPVPLLALGDLLTAVAPGARVAGIVSNPPYIASSEMADLPAEIREYEPHEALHAGSDGLGLIHPLLDQVAPFLARGAFACLEIGATQGEAVLDAVAARGLGGCARLFPDLAGRPRVLLLDPA